MTKYPGLTKEEIEQIRRRKISEARKGIPVPEERRRRISETEKGKFVSKETCRKISIANSHPLKITDLKTQIAYYYRSRKEAIAAHNIRTMVADILNNRQGRYKNLLLEDITVEEYTKQTNK